jgi:hypothetical protein
MRPKRRSIRQMTPRRFMTLRDSAARRICYIRSVLAACVFAALLSCKSLDAPVGKDWQPVKFSPSEATSPYLLIECSLSGLRFNGELLSKEMVLQEIRKSVPLIPRPLIYVTFSLKSQDAARSLAREVSEMGACIDGGCVYQIVAQ